MSDKAAGQKARSPEGCDGAIEAVESIVREYYLRKHAPAAPSAKSFNINCPYQLIPFVGYSKEINIA